MRITTLLATASMALFVFTADSLAADIESVPGRQNFYVAASAGLIHPFDPEFDAVGASGELDFVNGWTGAIAFGWSSNHWRAELELAARENELESIHIDGLGSLDVSGDSKVISALAKLAYEFEAGLFRPYAAVGLGIAEYQIDLNGPAPGSDDEMVLAGILELGITLPMSPDAELFSSAQLLILGSPFLDPNNTGGAELERPTFLSGSGGVRLHF
jgi:hypothetical protein